MTLRTSDLSSSLNSALRSVSFTNVEETAQQAIDNFDATLKTTLGGAVNEIQGGVQALTQEIDNAEDLLKSQLTPVVSRVTSQVDGVTKLIGKVSPTAASDIEAITGKAESAVNGFIDDIISVGSPEAISTSLKNAADFTTEEIQNTLTNLTTDALNSVVTQALDVLPFKEFETSVNSYVNQINSFIEKNTNFLMVDFGEKIERNFENNVNALLGTSVMVSRDDIRSSFNFVANEAKDKGFSVISKYFEKPEDYDYIVQNVPRSQWSPEVEMTYNEISEAEGKFKTLSVELSSYTNQFLPNSSAAGRNSNDVYSPNVILASARTGTSTGNDTWDFSDILSTEQLESMFRNVDRNTNNQIAGAIIHWSATFLDQNIGSEWLHRVHKNRGFAGCGYHIIIRRDGTLQRGRPLNRRGAHDINNNDTFLGFCFIGGVNEYAARAKKPYWRYASSQSFTPAQWTSYDKLMRTFHNVFPYAQVQGHYATSNDGKQDPGFDVPGYSQSKFGHTNIISETDPRWKSSTAITINDIKPSGILA